MPGEAISRFPLNNAIGVIAPRQWPLASEPVSIWSVLRYGTDNPLSLRERVRVKCSPTKLVQHLGFPSHNSAECRS